MKNAIKGYSLLFYLLLVPIGFIGTGTLIAGLGVGKGQGLASAGIVVGYAMMGTIFCLIVGIMLTITMEKKYIIKTNYALAGILLVVVLLFSIRWNNRQNPSKEPPSEPATPTQPVSFSHPQRQSKGLGFFSPDYMQHPKHYFYGAYSPGAWEGTGPIQDSLVFFKNELGMYDIAYAPPFFYPQHLKLDYDRLLLKVISLGRTMVEVEVNQQTGQTVLMERANGNLIYWPEFLLPVFSVEALPCQQVAVRIKPQEDADEVRTEYVFLQAAAVRGQWLNVTLLDKDFKPLGNGWIRWEKENQMLVTYSLFS